MKTVSCHFEHTENYLLSVAKKSIHIHLHVDEFLTALQVDTWLFVTINSFTIFTL